MRCLHCGKELALLKRLTSGGDFCSDAHKHSYQEEYNRLALSRLLQAQKKGQTSAKQPSQNGTPQPNTAFAVEDKRSVPAATVQVVEGATAQAADETVVDLAVMEEPATARSDFEISTGTESEPSGTAGFLLLSPSIAALPEETPYLESWLELETGPAMAEWQLQNEDLGLSSPDLVSLDLHPQAPESERSGVMGDLMAQPFTSAGTSPVLSWVARTNRLPEGEGICIDVAPISWTTAPEGNVAQPIGFQSEVLFDGSPLLELSPTSIEYRAADSDVVLVARSHNTPAAEAPELAPLDTREERTETAEIAETTPEESKPGALRDLFEISIKTFPPTKPALIGGDAFPSQTAPVVPYLKSLPLRPKVALASGYVPPSEVKAPELKRAMPTAPVAKPQAMPASPKPAPAAKAAARTAQPKQFIQPSKPAPPQQAAKTPAAVVIPPEAVQPAPIGEAPATKIDVVESLQPPKQIPAQPGPPISEKKAEGKRANPVAVDTAPTFAATDPVKVPFTGSLKAKLAIAIVLVVAACTGYLGWGGKAAKNSKPDGELSGDTSQLNIVAGQGGWVEKWGGDLSGMHSGRQITLYRPSLKLSDYRLEFEGSIDSNALGWVFRASDPANYYAMKLMKVSSSASSNVALYKYRIVAGRQTQAGRVSTELAARPGTVFAIRVEVRGSQFTTNIQGQQIDVWSDDELKTGGVGFLNEREERGTVRSVFIRSLSGATK